MPAPQVDTVMAEIAVRLQVAYDIVLTASVIGPAPGKEGDLLAPGVRLLLQNVTDDLKVLSDWADREVLRPG